MSDKDLNFAIVGCGRIAPRHAGHIANVGRLRAVCDTVESRAAKLGEAHQAAAFSNIDDMLAECAGDIDVVAVCTPNGMHAEHAIKSFRAGCHVLCEKPMAISVQACGDMIQAGETANRRLFVVKQNRYNPPVVAVRELLESGRLGKVCSAHLNCYWNRDAAYYENSWKGSLEQDGGCLYTQFSHFIDLLYWLVGDVREVAAVTGNFCHRGIVEFEDAGGALLRFYNGAIGSINFTINSFGRNMEGSLTLFCEKGTVKIGGQYLNELEYQSLEGAAIEGLPEGRPPNEYGQYQGSMSNHDKVYENVVDVLHHEGIIGTGGFEGLKTVEIIDKIYSAAARAS
jgi:predicted dehydrogenase